MRTLLLLLIFAFPAAAQPFVWAEAEGGSFTPPLAVERRGKSEYLSGGKWVSASTEQVPADGVTAKLSLAVESFGKFDLWVRIGYEFARSPFRWRIDEREWTTVEPDQYTTDLMVIAEDAEVAWLNLGTVELPAGTRTLEIHVPKPTGRLLFAVDCAVACRLPFRPNGPHKPGRDWPTPADKAAEEVVFDLTKSADGRSRLDLGGTWQVARFDEPGEIEDRTGPVKEMPKLDDLYWRAATVPGDKGGRPELEHCHRFLYRCRVNVPVSPTGKAFVLRFPNNSLMTTVFVNGKRVAFNDTPCAAFDADCTAAIVPGRVNEIVAAVKDHYYAIARTADAKSCRHLFHLPPDRFHAGGLGPTRFADYPVLGSVRRAGILEVPTLTAGGPVSVSDVSVKPDVAKEVPVRGNLFTVNGVPWHFRADSRHEAPASDPLAAVAEWRKNGQNVVRIQGERPWTGNSMADTLAFFDRQGIAVQRSGLFDNRLAHYQVVLDGKPNKPLFDNWRRQLAAWVKAERNHPCIFAWSLGTDLAAGKPEWAKVIEPELQAAVDLVRGLHPTRPVVFDDRHQLPALRDLPDAAYTSATEIRPSVLDVEMPPSFAEVIGEPAFLGRRSIPIGASKIARMLGEGYRWRGVAAVHFGFDAGDYQAWQPVCVLCREWDGTFAVGAKVTRTLKAFNDTRSDSPVSVHYLFQTKGTPVVQYRGTKMLKIPPGEAREFGIELPMPATAGPAELVLSCVRDGKEVFRDVKPVRVIDPKRDTPADGVLVFDPAGKVPHVAGTRVTALDNLPACRVLVVGPDAVTKADANSPKWAAIAARGVRVVVLDQTHPLHGPATPADLEPTPHAGRIVFPEHPVHPAFAGLVAADFDFWSGDHVVYRNAYRKPTRGARSLASCDVELGCSSLVEVPVGDGILLLSQFVTKPTDPVSQSLTANLIRHAHAYRRIAKPTTVVLPPNDSRAELLKAAGLKFQPTDATNALSGLVAILDGSTDNVKALDPDAVAKFTARGGTLVLWTVTPDALADFNKLVGQDHVMRLFFRERVTLTTTRLPLAAGLSLRDFAADDTFTHVVDLTDPAAFVVDAKPADGWRRMTDGLTSADSREFVFQHDQKQFGDRPTWSATLARPETLTGLGLVVNADYRTITKLRVTFDGDPNSAVTLDLKPVAERLQSFLFPPRKCSRIALEPLAWTPHEKPVIGLDELWLTADRPADFADKVRPLTTVGGLVWYPQGAGGILLCQLNPHRNRAVIETLLRNLGAEFR